MHGYSLMSFTGAILIASFCYAFISDHLASANLPPAWNVVPFLETEFKVTADHSSSVKTQEASSDKVSQTSDLKKSTQAAEQTVPQDRIRDKRDFLLEAIGKDTLSTKTINAATNSAEESVITDSMASAPRNTILLLVTESGPDRKDLWNYKTLHSFPVKGFLQNFHTFKIKGVRFPLDEALFSDNKDEKCHCNEYLKWNIGELLMWARDAKGMATGTLLNSDFTSPSLLGYEEPVSVPGELDELDENTKPNVRKARSEIRGDWYLIDLGQPVNHASSMIVAPNIREDGADDSAWDIFDVFSKIRMALFRSLLESLAGNAGISEDPISSNRSHPMPSNLANIIRELKSIQDQRGFILVVATSANELESAIDTLQREVSDVLMVITRICAHDKKPMPFFASGPGAKMLHKAVALWEIPIIIKNILASGCHDSSCRIRQHEFAPLSSGEHKVDSPKETFFKRPSRNAAEKIDSEAKKVRNSNTKEEIKDESKGTPSDIRRGATSVTETMKFTTVLGKIASTLVTFTLAP